MAVAAAVLAVVGAVVGAIGAMKQGEFAAAAAEREAIQHEEQARLAKMEAAQEEVIRLEEARKTRTSNVAQAAALGFDPTQSRSFGKIQSEVERIADRDIENIQLRGLLRHRTEILNADASRTEGKAAKTGAAYSALGSLLKGASSSITAYKGTK